MSLKNSLVDEDGDVDINTYTTVEHETSFIEGYRRRVKEGRMAAGRFGVRASDELYSLEKFSE